MKNYDPTTNCTITYVSSHILGFKEDDEMKKIEPINYIVDYPSEINGIATESICYYLRDMADKLNEVIEAINQLNEKGDTR